MKTVKVEVEFEVDDNYKLKDIQNIAATFFNVEEEDVIVVEKNDSE
jgi:hypothetical protein